MKHLRSFSRKIHYIKNLVIVWYALKISPFFFASFKCTWKFRELEGCVRKLRQFKFWGYEVFLASRWIKVSKNMQIRCQQVYIWVKVIRQQHPQTIARRFLVKWFFTFFFHSTFLLTTHNRFHAQKPFVNVTFWVKSEREAGRHGEHKKEAGSWGDSRYALNKGRRKRTKCGQSGKCCARKRL